MVATGERLRTHGLDRKHHFAAGAKPGWIGLPVRGFLGPCVDGAHRSDLRRGEAVRRFVALALQGSGIEPASAGRGYDTVLHAVIAIACRHGGFVDHRKLRRRDRLAASFSVACPVHSELTISGTIGFAGAIEEMPS